MKKFVIGGFVLFVFLSGITKIDDYDLFWHLKTGEYILSNRKVPTEDIFSFTAEGKRWIAQSWLVDVIFYSAHRLAGYNGLIIFKSLLLSFTFFFLLKLLLKKKISLPVAVLVLILTVLVAQFRFQVRPHIFKYLFVVLFLYILNDYFEFKKNRLYLLPILTLLWANLHGSFFLGYIIIGAFLLAELVKRYYLKYPSEQKLKPLFLNLFLTILVPFFNPAGYCLHEWMIKLFSRTLSGAIINEEFLPPTFKGNTFFWIFLLITGISFSLPIFLKKEEGRFNLTQLLCTRAGLTNFFLFLPFAYLAVKGIRYIAVFAILSASVLSENLNLLKIEIRPEVSGEKISILLNASLFAAMLATLFLIFAPWKAYQFGLGLKRGIYPDKAIEFIEKNQIQGNIYNPEEFGGYLIWEWYPKRKVFLFNDNLLFEEIYKRIYQEDGETFARYRINCILKSYRHFPIEDCYLRQKNWHLVYWEDTALVYLKENEENKNLIAQYGYRYIDPRNSDFSYWGQLVKHNYGSQAVKELMAALTISPDSFRAHLFSGYLCEAMEDKRVAIKFYQRASEIKPGAAYIHYRLGTKLGKLALETKEIDLAIDSLEKQKKYTRDKELYFLLGTAYAEKPEEKAKIRGVKILRKALKLSPGDSAILSNLAFAYYGLGYYLEAIKEFKSSLETNPHLANSYYGLALCYEKLNLREKAIESWEKYIIHPTDEEWAKEAKKHLAFLKGEK